MKLFLPAAMSVLFSGCVSASFTQSSSDPVAPKDPNCAFAVVNAKTDRAFTEIGVLDISPGFIQMQPRDMASFKTVVSKQVCAAGGDAIIPEVNGLGQYIRGVIIRWSPSK